MKIDGMSSSHADLTIPPTSPENPPEQVIVSGSPTAHATQSEVEASHVQQPQEPGDGSHHVVERDSEIIARVARPENQPTHVTGPGDGHVTAAVSTRPTLVIPSIHVISPDGATEPDDEADTDADQSADESSRDGGENTPSSLGDQPVQVTFRGVSLAGGVYDTPERAVVSPRCGLFRNWEVLSTLCVFLTCLIIPFQACLDSSVAWLWVLAYAFDALFLVDVLMRFRVGYFHKGSLITDKKKVRTRYLRGSFALDLLTLLPLDLFVLIAGSGSRWHQMLSLLRLNRVLRISRLFSFFTARENELGSKTSLIRAFKYMAIGSIMVHSLSCVWYAFGCPNEGAADHECYDGAWAVELGTGLQFASTTEKYAMSLYWATATATSTGYGDIHAVTTPEKWFSVLAMLVGVALFFGLILGGMASMLTNLDSQRARYIHHLNVIKDHMSDMQITSDIQNRVVAYYDYLWIHNHGVNGVGMFDNLPLTFQAELSLSVNRKVLDKAPLFRGLNPGFKRMLSLVIKPVFYMPNQIIASRGDIGHHMFYIHKGKAEILSEDDKDVLVILGEEKLFGEVSMVYNLPRSASVRAATPCVIFLLDRADLNRVLKHYPDVAEKLYMAVETRCDLDQAPTVTADSCNKETILNMEPSTAEKWVRDNVAERDSDKVSVQSHLRRLAAHVILPDSWLAVIWGRVVLVTMLAVCFVYSFVASFSVSLHFIGYGESMSSEVLFGITYIWDMVFVLDFFMRFNRATPTTSDLREIRRKYIGSFLFFVDLLAILPMELLAFTQDGHDRWHAVSFYRLNRLVKAVRITTFFSSMENSLEFGIGRVRALKFTIYIALITHFSACIWFFEACYEKNCADEGWAQHVNVANSTAGLREYIASMYWAAATMSSTGYGDIHAHDTGSQLVSIVVMLCGLLLYGYCLSSIAATLANSAAPKVEFVEKISAVKEFMLVHGVGSDLIGRVDLYLSNLWRVYRGEAVPGGTRLLEDMPVSLQQDVCFEETRGYLERVPIFMETDPGFQRLLSLKTTSYLFTPGDYIVYAGDMGREMYCVRRGLVEVIGDDEITVVATLGPGGYFGEIGLIFGESRLATVRAKTYCEILMLTKPDLDEVLGAFPIVARQISEAGVNEGHLKDVRKAAFEASKKAVRRLSLQHSQKKKSSTESRKSQRDRSKELFQKMTQSIAEEDEEFDIDQKLLDEEFKRPFSDLSWVSRPLSWLLMRRAIMPGSRFLLVWQAISLTISAILPVTLSFQAAFLHTSTALWVANYLFDLFFLVDMYIKCHVAFYNSENVLVTHPLYTARNYFRANFPLDLVASFPTDIIVVAVWPEHLGILRILSLARLNRGIHLYKLNQFFGYMEESIGKQTNVIRQLKFAVYMIIFTHCIACGWFLLACDGVDDGGHVCKHGSWTESLDHHLEKDTVVQYVTSLYWAAATSASVGYGDIHAMLVSEMTYALICMIIGIVFYGYIIASVAASLANADAKRARYQERLADIENFLEDQDVSEHLAARIRSYYEYLWIRNEGVDPSSLFEGLPLSLQADITLSLYKDMIERVPLFEGTEIGFLKMLSMNVRPMYFLSKEYIVRKGDIGQEMYFIHSGIVQVVSEHEEPIIFDTMNEGRFFGEISIVFSCPRTASIRAQTNCDLFVLTKHDLDEVLSHYPAIRTKILETAEERQRMVRERAAAAAAKKKQEEEDRKKKQEEDRLAQQAQEGEQDGDKVDADGDNTKPAIDKKANESEAPKDDPTDVAIDIDEPDSERVTCAGRCRSSLASMFVNFIIKPDSKLNYLKFINCALVFATSLTITYMAALQHHTLPLIVFNYVCEVFFYIEIYFNFHTVYLSDMGELITEPRKLALHYAKGRFPFDFVASFPIDLFALAAPTGTKLEILSYLRMLHLLRLVRIQQFFSDLGKRLNVDVFRVRMSNFFVQVLLVVHIFACGWQFIACADDECNAHEQAADEHHEGGHVAAAQTPLMIYADAVYWAVATMTSTGYGDLHAETTIQKLYASLVMVFGKLLFGFILGNIASTLANAEIRRVQYEENLGAIQAHMEDQQISTTLQDRVMNFYEFIWNKNKGRDHRGLFYDMPQCMHAELYMAIVKDVICKVPLFEDTELAFVRSLCTKVKPGHFHAGEYIVQRGDIDEKMYIIRQGMVEVVTDEDPPEVMETFEEGTFFGERNLVFTSPRDESFRAVTNVDVLVLTKEDVDSVLSCYEDVAAHVQSMASMLYPGLAVMKSK